MGDAHTLFCAGGVGPVRGAGGRDRQCGQYAQPGQDPPGSTLAGQVSHQSPGPAPDRSRHQRRVSRMTQSLSRQCIHDRPRPEQPVQYGAKRAAHPIKA